MNIDTTRPRNCSKSGDIIDPFSQHLICDFFQNVEDILLDVNAQELLMQEYPADCCPVRCYLHFPCMVGDEDSPFWQGWANLRVKTYRLIENKYFETAVIAMILLSSLALVGLYT